MAEGHEVSDDGRLWRIRLREALRFHDGKPVLAHDCAASSIPDPARNTIVRIKSVVPELTFATIFRGVAPFIVTDLLRLVLLAAVPALATWLPGVLR